MIYVFALATAASVALLTFGVVNIATTQSRIVKRRLGVLRAGDVTYRELQERRRRQAKRDRLRLLLESVGDKVATGANQQRGMRQMLVEAGYRTSRSVAIFMGTRIIFASLFMVGAILLLGFLHAPADKYILYTAISTGAGWYIPFFYVRRRRALRQQELSKALPDMLDLLVVCVEAGLGLNQALVRVAEEIDQISPETSDEITVVNLEIRAGKPREEALRNMGQRTGLSDIRALITMLVQTDRFGTSVADALRVHADTLRTVRMQRAQEKAAKVSAKLVFPLVLLIFPATSVVILGPGLIKIFAMFGRFG
ncbi:MAG: type II secretion system F family protein [Gemmatimonadota bacterium]